MDASMQVEGEMLFQAGTHQDVIRLKFQDWLRLVSPRVASFSEPESAHFQPPCADREDRGTAGPERAEGE